MRISDPGSPPAMLRWRKKVLPFQMSSMTAKISTVRTTTSLRALARRELVANPALVAAALRTAAALTAQRLTISLVRNGGKLRLREPASLRSGASSSAIPRLPATAMVRTAGVEPALPYGEEDFKSPASTVPP